MDAETDTFLVAQYGGAEDRARKAKAMRRFDYYFEHHFEVKLDGNEESPDLTFKPVNRKKAREESSVCAVTLIFPGKMELTSTKFFISYGAGKIQVSRETMIGYLLGNVYLGDLLEAEEASHA